MAKTIAIVVTLDTKGVEVDFLKGHIEQRGHKTVVVDVGMGSKPLFEGDITCEQVARAGGATIEELRASQDRYKANEIMITGAIKEMKKLADAGILDGIISIGGASATFLATSIMKALPFGIPKLMVSSNAAQPGFASRYFGTKDITIMHAIVDIAGLNDLVTSLITQAAGAICGMVESGAALGPATSLKPSVALTTLGVCEKCAKHIRQSLEGKGYQVSIFSAQGIGDSAMEQLIEQGLFQGVIDLSPGGIIDALCEGTRAGSPQRLETAGEKGIPQVIAPCGLDFITPRLSRYKPEYKTRTRHQIDEYRVMLRSSPEELVPAANIIASKLNKAKGPVKFLIPLRGWSALDGEGRPLGISESATAFVDELRKALKPDIEIREIDAWIEDPDFASAVVTAFEEMIAH